MAGHHCESLSARIQTDGNLSIFFGLVPRWLACTNKNVHCDNESAYLSVG